MMSRNVIMVPVRNIGKLGKLAIIHNILCAYQHFHLLKDSHHGANKTFALCGACRYISHKEAMVVYATMQLFNFGQRKLAHKDVLKF